jgi:hypothetical protein
MTSQHPDQPGDPPQDLTQEEPLPQPGWATVTPPPGPGNPDLAPPGEYDDAAAASSGPDASRPGSTRGSTPKPLSTAKITAGGLGDAMTAIFRGVGQALNHWTALSDEDDIWLPTDAEAKGVGEPLGRIIARRVPDLPAGEASDLADGITAAIPLLTYGVKNAVAWLGRRRKRKVVPRQVVAPDLAGQPAPGNGTRDHG